METKISAGILVYRKNKKSKKVEVLMVHPGGPYWQNREWGSWHIPKGGVEEKEYILKAAIREFKEETNLTINSKDSKRVKYLCRVKSGSGKIVHIFYLEKDFRKKSFGCSKIKIEAEWPPGSGKKIFFPENDKIEYVELEIAKKRIISYQLPALLKLEKIIFSK